MTRRIPAIKTEYNGITFRSALEAKYAKAFDRLGIVWEYEPGGFKFADGTCYAPDFYMPEIKTFFEVKGVMDEESERKLRNLALDKVRVCVGMANGELEWIVGSKFAPAPVKTTVTDKAKVVECSECGTVYILEDCGDWSCPACGRGGDGFSMFADYDSCNMFEAAGWGNA